jgi:hypothetical protein
MPFQPMAGEHAAATLHMLSAAMSGPPPPQRNTAS